MKKLLRRVLLCVLMLGIPALLGGCGLLKPAESLYALPALPEEYAQLQTGIQEVMDEMAAEYATISYGSNTSTIQMLDLDNDYIQETVAVFLRATSAEEKPLRICLFRRGSDDTYRLTYTIQGDGTSINSVSYEDLTGDGVCEVVVSWQMGAKVHILSAYQLTAAGASELMNTTYNEMYLTADLDKDGCREILVFQQHSADGESNRAEYYRYQDGVMIMASAAPLSNTMTDVVSAKAGPLSDGVAGVYVTCEAEGGVLTDILTLCDGALCNVSLDKELGMSQSTLRPSAAVSATDINRDGVIEVPLPYALPSMDPEAPSAYSAMIWRQFDSAGNCANICVTFHAVSNGWYLTIPGDWLGQITVSQDDSRSAWGERAVIFYYWPDREESRPRSFLTIYRLTGDNRNSRARISGRQILRSDSSAIYCAALNNSEWDCGLEMADIAQQFNLITTEWSSQ